MIWNKTNWRRRWSRLVWFGLLSVPASAGATAFEPHTANDPLPERPIERPLSPGTGNLRLAIGLDVAQSDRQYDDDREYVYAAGRLTRSAYRIQAEYGLTPYLSIFGVIPWLTLDYKAKNPNQMSRLDLYPPTRGVLPGDRFHKQGLGDTEIGARFSFYRADGELKGDYIVQGRLMVPSGETRSDFSLPFVYNLGMGVLGFDLGLGARQMLCSTLAVRAHGGVRLFRPDNVDYIVSAYASETVVEVFGNARFQAGNEYYAEAAIEWQADDDWFWSLGFSWMMKEESEFENKIVYIDPNTGLWTQYVPTIEIPNSLIENYILEPKVEYRYQENQGVRAFAEIPLAGRNTDALFPHYFNAYRFGLDWLVEF